LSPSRWLTLAQRRKPPPIFPQEELGRVRKNQRAGTSNAQTLFTVGSVAIKESAMKQLFAAAVVASLAGISLAGGALAQNMAPPAANHHASTPAIASPNVNNPGAPAAGANSFTRAQARSRIEKAGYSNISGLVKDKNGIWRGTATKGGQNVSVALDYQGNVVGR
jgi:hypothetical protein